MIEGHSGDHGITEIINENDWSGHLRMTPRLSRLLNEHRFFFGDRQPEQVPIFQLDKRATIEPYTSLFNGNFVHTMGVYSYSFSELNRFGVSVGRYCSIAGAVYCMGGQHPMDRVTSSNITFEGHQPHHRAGWADLFEGRQLRTPFGHAYRAPVIEHDVWVGDRAQLREGVRLGTGCVVGSAAVVSKDVPPYAVVVGNPAVIKKFRFPYETISRLLASRWWEYRPRTLFDLGHEEVGGFLDKFEVAKADGKLQPFAPEPLTWQSLRAKLKASD